jgi:hypothetical protein
VAGGDPRALAPAQVVKNKAAYTQQAWVEVQVTRLLNERHDVDDARHIVRRLGVLVERAGDRYLFAVERR